MKRAGVLLAALLLSLTAHAAGLSAGAGKAAVAISAVDLPVDGFVSVHDPLYVRAIVLANDTRRIALVTVDMTSMSAELVAQVQATVARQARVAASDVLVSASHTFSTPHLQGPGADAAEQARKQRMGQAVQQAVAAAAAQAAANLQPATLGYGSGTSSVNVNRDLPTAAGWWLGANDAGPSDKTVGVVRLDGANHQPIAVIVNYAVQSSIMNESTLAAGGKAITADLAGAAMAHVERQLGKQAVALFLVGAAGDQAPYLSAVGQGGDAHEAGFMLVRLLGERLGSEAVRVAQGIRTLPANPVLSMDAASVTVTGQASNPQAASKHPSKTYAFQATGPVQVPYWTVRVGDIGIIGVQVELSSQTGVALRERSGFAHTLVATMVNGAAKYLPDAGSYERITYEAMSSPYAKGSAEALRKALSP